MGASIKPLSLEEFLDWERSQPLRYEFDGIQPIGMTGGTPLHGLIIARLITAAGTRLKQPCEVYASEVKVITDKSARYPDLTILCSTPDGTVDWIEPTVIFEVLSPSTTPTDRRVKPVEYRSVSSVMVYVIAAQDKADVTVLRRASGWTEEVLVGKDAILALPEVGITIPLSEIYR